RAIPATNSRSRRKRVGFLLPSSSRGLVASSISGSEGNDDVVDLLPVAGLLDVGDLPAATIGDARFRDLVVVDCVVGIDVLGADHAGDPQFAQLEVDAYLLTSGDHHVAVRQAIGHHRGNLQLDVFIPLDLAVAPGGGAAAEVRQGIGVVIASRHDIAQQALQAEQ